MLTFGSPVIILKASFTCDAVAPPPTSKKFAGDPPCNLMISMVAIASPAPFTIHPKCGSYHSREREYQDLGLSTPILVPIDNSTNLGTNLYRHLMQYS